ncbi:MAG TPA: sigma-70 family RNA polymerase sigma factor [Anaerohalosphaeraceae bacterium]|nr:sigma-70 family RNA polymerase sigma factor [Phycisphaerae bacterium]HOL32236.1 sigma-70 family RNA polymerase sigma factor [Anaerohalosphaeraceae bacterium]HOM75837.1 sigma-70 family RNA polymerase sigma factor [Anaerohalosphaeraceae bacterium]HPC65160.1 sigma-70 family RNA polymerase sigma factor [Anaerohalosphaeraceae bacterium]HPO68763.1 sigma-70 family RNA polymerase sigma factor [Anaerohalosphaeraceae bacterium]
MDSDRTKTEYFIHLLSSNHYRIYAYIQSVVINEADADDIMQDTSTIMWKKFDDFSAGTDFVAWGISIAKYRILEYRKKKKDCFLSQETLDLLAAQSEKMMPELERRFQALKDCLGKLPRKDLELLKLRYTHSCSAKMIALRIGTTIHMVYQNMSRIKMLLVNCVQKQLRTGDF